MQRSWCEKGQCLLAVWKNQSVCWSAGAKGVRKGTGLQKQADVRHRGFKGKVNVWGFILTMGSYLREFQTEARHNQILLPSPVNFHNIFAKKF